MSIILVHELGHLIAAKLYKWKTDKIYIYPLGGITKFNDNLNKPLKEELIIVLAGPIFQIIYYIILTNIGINDISIFHYVLLVFNLLPIYPLDGGKILNILLCYFISYKMSYKVTIYISYVVYFLCLINIFIFYKSIFFFIVLLFLIFKIIDEYKKINYYFNKFLLERYLNDYKFKKIKYLDNIKNMFRDRKHYFYYDNSIMTEKELLRKYFKF